MNAENKFEKWWNNYFTERPSAEVQFTKDSHEDAFLAALAIGRKTGIKEALQIAIDEASTDCNDGGCSDIIFAIRQRIEVTP